MSKLIQTCRQGFSLLEVLVSVFVVLVGLLGVATMIPAGRYEMLQARKADMGADLSRAVVNSIVTQISNGWNPGGNDYYVVANYNDGDGSLAEKLKNGISKAVTNKCPQTVSDDRTFNGDDDVAIMEGDNNQFQLALDNGKVVGTGAYSACATIVYLGYGYYEVTGLTVYRYSDLEEGSGRGPKLKDATDYKRGSYAFFSDDSGISRWYKIENVSTTGIDTVVGYKQTADIKYLGDVIGISRKVVRIDDSYPIN